MPPHECYVEAFLGSGAIMRTKRPAARNIGVDRDAAALDGFRALVESECCSIALSDVEVLHGNALADDWLLQFYGPSTLIYCDPPYVHSTRTGGVLYRFEMTNDDHLMLLDQARRSTCRFMISGYRSALYEAGLQGWHSIDYQAHTRGGMKTETLWMNFAPPTTLHDYRFLGQGYRERERIKRKKARWIERLKRMDRLERQAILAAIAEGIET